MTLAIQVYLSMYEKTNRTIKYLILFVFIFYSISYLF